MLIGGVLMISLGIIGTYIAQIYQEVKYRPRYVVAQTLIGIENEELAQTPENKGTQTVAAIASKSSV
jgi:hypothetical protein